MDLKSAETYILNRLDLELDARLSYHNKAHTLAVREAVLELCQKEGIMGTNRCLLETAALFHDSGFLLSRDEHETSSCELARQALPDFGYQQQEIEAICSLIMATRSGHSPVSLEECIMRDADLFYLGTNEYGEISKRLKEELKNFDLLQNENDWTDLQIRFLEHHQYYTESAASLMDEGKKNTLTLLKKQAHV